MTRIANDIDHLMHLARLVYAMRRAQKKLSVYDIYNKPEKRAQAKRSATEYEKAVDYMVGQLLGDPVQRNELLRYGKETEG